MATPVLPGTPYTDPVSLAKSYLQHIEIDLTMVGSDQEMLRRLEAAVPHPLAAVRVGVFIILTGKELSILDKYATDKRVGPRLAEWAERASAARAGNVRYHPEPSPFFGGREVFVVKVVDAPGPRGSSLMLNPTRCFESNLDLALEVSYETLYGAQEQEFAKLHVELLSALARVGWLTDQFGHHDPKALDAAQRLKTTTAPATTKEVK